MNQESILAELIKQLELLIDIDNIDEFNNFYENGGNSLLSMHFLLYIEESFGVSINPKELFELNIKDLSVLIEKLSLQ